MLTERERMIVTWLQKKKVATMRQMRERFKVAHMTVFRALKKQGYFTSYNHKGAYYTLSDVPDFDEWGLWSYRDIHFSKNGTLADTLVHLVENADAGQTTQELAAQLQVDVAHTLSSLVNRGHISRQSLVGRQVVYLASTGRQSRKQLQQRQKNRVAAKDPDQPIGVPDEMATHHVIEILRQIILSPDGDPNLWSRQLKTHGVPTTAGEVLRVIEYYSLEQKKNGKFDPRRFDATVGARLKRATAAGSCIAQRDSFRVRFAARKRCRSFDRADPQDVLSYSCKP